MCRVYIASVLFLVVLHVTVRNISTSEVDHVLHAVCPLLLDVLTNEFQDQTQLVLVRDFKCYRQLKSVSADFDVAITVVNMIILA